MIGLVAVLLFGWIGLSCGGSPPTSSTGTEAPGQREDAGSPADSQSAPPALPDRPGLSLDAASSPSAQADAASSRPGAAADAAMSDGAARDTLAPARDAGAAEHPTGAVPSAGCQARTVFQDGLQTLTVEGRARTFYLHAPRGYAGDHPYPVVLAFHGASRSGKDYESTSSKDVFAFRAVMGGDAILAFPNALPNAEGNTEWSQADLSFFDALIETIGSTLCVDRSRVFVIGHSSGAFFSTFVACRRGDTIRGFAPIEGGLWTTDACKGHPAAFLVHGLKDMIVSIKNGERNRDYWAKRNACAVSDPTAIDPAPCTAYAGCRPEGPVAWCPHEETAYSGTGHGWPTFATRGLWAFFGRL